MEGSRLYQLEKQLELADMVIKLTSSHMWNMFAERTVNEALVMKAAIKKEIYKEMNA